MNKRIRLDPACQKYSKEIFIFVRIILSFSHNIIFFIHLNI